MTPAIRQTVGEARGVDLDVLETLAKAATPGPWVPQSPSDGQDDNDWYIDTHHYADGPEPVVLQTGHYYVVAPVDACYIAAADPSTILILIDELRALRAAADGSAS